MEAEKKQEIWDWAKIGAGVFLAGFIIWTISVQQANKVDYGVVGVEVIPTISDIADFKSSFEYEGSAVIVTAPILPEIAFVVDQPLPPLMVEEALPEIVFYDDGLPEILPPLVDVVFPPLEG